jgi:hypothetical protein
VTPVDAVAVGAAVGAAGASATIGGEDGATATSARALVGSATGTMIGTDASSGRNTTSATTTTAHAAPTPSQRRPRGDRPRPAAASVWAPASPAGDSRATDTPVAAGVEGPRPGAARGPSASRAGPLAAAIRPRTPPWGEREAAAARPAIRARGLRVRASGAVARAAATTRSTASSNTRASSDSGGGACSSFCVSTTRGVSPSKGQREVMSA